MEQQGTHVKGVGGLGGGGGEGGGLGGGEGGRNWMGVWVREEDTCKRAKTINSTQQ